MERKNAKAILNRFHKGAASKEEIQQIKDWMMFGEFSDLGISEKDMSSDLAELDKRILTYKLKRTSVISWRRAVAVAASILLVSTVGFFGYRSYQNRLKDHVVVASDLAPGRNAATLTLADGTKIKLADAVNGQLARQAGVVISKTADGELVYELKGNGVSNQMNTVSTSNGETYRVKLPDGSLVWLNSGSSLTYAASLVQAGKRLVSLSGEGYFEVAKDKSALFVVETSGQQVEVLGTHFNVNGYKDEPLVATTLLEGSVRVSAGKNVQTIVPGEQLKNIGGQLMVAKVNTENITDWKEGEFNLQGLDFRTAMRKIARWYDVEVIYEPSVPKDIEAGGWIKRNSKLSAVLKLIENSGLVKFKVEGRKVYVYK